MITAKQETHLLSEIKSLSELEFSSFLKECADHIWKNKWDHIIDECFDIETFESELYALKELFDELRDEKYDLERRLEKAIDALDDMEDSIENTKLMKILAA